MCLLVTAWVWSVVRCMQRPSVGAGLIAGVLFGLTALCRPTVWVGGGLVGIFAAAWWWHAGAVVSGVGTSDPVGPRLNGGCGVGWRRCVAAVGAAVVGMVLVVSPWVVRNQRVLGSPILTTTHGGYTLLLGNNPDFYAEVVRRRGDGVWDGETGLGQALWFLTVGRDMKRDVVEGEVEQDRWMSAEAWRHMADDPGGCALASLQRLVSFWSIVPRGEARADWPRVIVWGVGGFYAAIWLGVIVGVAEVLVRPRCYGCRCYW